MLPRPVHPSRGPVRAALAVLAGAVLALALPAFALDAPAPKAPSNRFT